jgi:3-oxoacyl-[acyl-carrier protein] reductase
MADETSDRPVALVTGVGRTVGLGAAIALRLAEDGWNVATTHWSSYDDKMPWGPRPQDPAEVSAGLSARGARTVTVEADLTDVTAPARVFSLVETELGPVTALVMCHGEGVDSGLLDTTVDSFDRHYAVNVRASWLMLKEYAERCRAEPGAGRVIALTSDHVVHNLPYGVTKGALDRLVIASARELAHLRITANVVNPGPVDTGWMSAELREQVEAQSPLGRGGRPSDTADLVSFLCSPQGGWVNGQLLHSDGGLHVD